MLRGNPGCKLDLSWITSVRVNAWCVNHSVKSIPDEKRRISGIYRAAWLLRAVTCIDLTTLAGDDTRSNVVRLCRKAMRPIKSAILEKLDFRLENEEALTTAAVCVYPAKVGHAAFVIDEVDGIGVKIAAVATGFPSGQYNLQTRLMEIEHAVENGANEIDVVIDRSLVLTGKWEVLYEELQEMKKACGKAEMKTILATGELSTYENIYKASLVAMMAGSDFIKTSTGKETVNATLPVGLVMMRAIREYYKRTGHKVGFKAAGGIRTADDALHWLLLVKRELGNEWLNKDFFRIGASGLLADIEKDLYILAFNKSPAPYEFTLG
ncbi:UNVERIFIED_CONTAM: hypothetical protein PYX00_008984 [Menopon gallinae]|uniref:deoxyribose-phosphate aldolase n=1 Tax=Menopon gallinae TaxID=328185 RepID=A0AAW2H9G6_9NEOP